MKKLFTLLMLLLCVASSAWADGYTPSEDEVIILNEVYSANATDAGYSTHAAIAWGGTAGTSDKKAGDPSNNGAATSSNVACYSVKGNGKGKNITINISGCSKIIVYHESHSSRYLELRSVNKSGTLIGNGSTSTYYTEVDLDGTKSYSIFLHGTGGSDDQDFYVYAVKLVKYVNKTISTQALSGVKVNGKALTENADEAGYNVNESIITLTDVAYVVPTNVTLTNHITYTDNTTEDKNVAVTFDDTPSDNFWIGTATIGTKEYTIKVPYSSQSVTGVTINGTAISAAELAALTSTKSVSIDGSSLNGIGMIGVTLSGGTANVTRTNSGNNVVYTFTINSKDEYTVTVTNLNKNYTSFDNVVYYSKDGTAVEGANTKSVTANGITFAMVDESKTLQYGSGKVTIGGAEYTPLKLSTGSAVSVTFPEGKKATKVKVYGWSANGDGKMYSIQETSDANGKKVGDLSADIFYATNTDKDIYPSVYEYELDEWESMYFNCGGSASQPFVVMDFQFTDTGIPEPAEPTPVAGKTVTWDFSSETAQAAAGTITAGQSNTLKATDGASVITYVAGSSDKYETSGGYYLKPNGKSGTNNSGIYTNRYFILNITKSGTISFVGANTSTKSGNYVILQGSSDDVADAVEKGTVANTASDCSYSVNVQDGEYVFVAFSSQIYTASVSWAENSDDIELTTTSTMQGWRSFYDAINSYTVDKNTKVYVATQENDGKVTLTEYAAGVPAGTPVILKTSAEAENDGTFKMTLTKTTETITPTYEGESLLKVTPFEGNWYRLGSKNGEVGFFPFNATGVTAGIVVLNIDSSNAGARSLDITFDDEATAIHNVNDNVNLNKVVFDLQGRRVLEPGKGLYIVNGKKVVIK